MTWRFQMQVPAQKLRLQKWQRQTEPYSHSSVPRSFTTSEHLFKGSEGKEAAILCLHCSMHHWTTQGRPNANLPKVSSGLELGKWWQLCPRLADRLSCEREVHIAVGRKEFPRDTCTIERTLDLYPPPLVTLQLEVGSSAYYRNSTIREFNPQEHSFL
jgi:hypothetical protein